MHAEQPELAEVLTDAVGQRARLEVLGHHGQELLAHVLPHRVADQALLVIELRVESERIERVEGRDGGGGGHDKERTPA